MKWSVCLQVGWVPLPVKPQPCRHQHCVRAQVSTWACKEVFHPVLTPMLPQPWTPSLSYTSSNTPVLPVEGGMVLGYRALTSVCKGGPTQTQHETTARRHARSLQNGWNWIQSVSPQPCHCPTMVIVRLCCCKMNGVKVALAPTASHKIPFELKFYYWLIYCLHVYSIRRSPLGTGLPCQPLRKRQVRCSLSQRASNLSSEWKRRKDNCFRNQLYLVKFKVADFCQAVQLSG